MAIQVEVKKIEVEGHEESYNVLTHDPDKPGSLGVSLVVHGGKDQVKASIINILTAIKIESLFEILGINEFV